MKKNLINKNWTLRIGAAALTLTMATTALVGGTFAKYVHSMAGTDKARVAKFDVSSNLGETQTESIGLFQTAYKSDTAEYTGEDTVQSTRTEKNVNGEDVLVNVVAPGTWGSFVLRLESHSEVAVKYDVKLELDETVNSIQTAAFDEKGNPISPVSVTQIPILFTVYEGAVSFDSEGNPSIDNPVNGFKRVSIEQLRTVTFGGEFAVNEVMPCNYTIFWEWAFEGANNGYANWTDAMDTALGLDGLSEITVDAMVTFTQID